jgi:predicted DCC family thiol-disulfide oxidoreductase YuxK
VVRCKHIAMLKDQATPPKAILFFDGDCPLCNRVLTFILSNEIRADLVFSPLDASSSERWREAHPNMLMEEDSVYYFDGLNLYKKSSAVLKLLPKLRWYTGFLRLGWLLPLKLRDRCYDFVARHRKRIFKECIIDPRLIGRMLQ